MISQNKILLTPSKFAIENRWCNVQQNVLNIHITDIDKKTLRRWVKRNINQRFVTPKTEGFVRQKLSYDSNITFFITSAWVLGTKQKLKEVITVLCKLPRQTTNGRQEDIMTHLNYFVQSVYKHKLQLYKNFVFRICNTTQLPLFDLLRPMRTCK